MPPKGKSQARSQHSKQLMAQKQLVGIPHALHKAESSCHLSLKPWPKGGGSSSTAPARSAHHHPFP